MPRPQVQFDTREVAVICNVTPRTWGPHMYNFGGFVVQGYKPKNIVTRHAAELLKRGQPLVSFQDCAEGEEYALTIITGRDTSEDKGELRRESTYIYASQIAKDLVRNFNDHAGSGRIEQDVSEDEQMVIPSNMGLFVCAGERPTRDELRVAREVLTRFYVARVATADSNWETRHSPLDVDAVDRRAARFLGLTDKPWLFDTMAATKCPVCVLNIPAGAAVCGHCGAVLNREVAAKYGLVVPPEAVSQKAAPQKTT